MTPPARPVFLLLATVLFLAGFVPSVHAAEYTGGDEDPLRQEIELLVHQADSLAGAGKLDTALVLGTRALEKARGEYGATHPLTASALSATGTVHPMMRNYEECESYLEEALQIRERALGPDHDDVAESLNDLSIVYLYQGRFREAEPLLLRALEIYRERYGTDDASVAKVLNNLAALYAEMGRYLEAEDHHREALAIKKKVLGPEHGSVAWSANNLGVLCLLQGRYREAESHLEEALAIWERTMGPDYPLVGDALINLANCSMEQNRYDEAERFLERGLSIFEKTLGPDHLHTAQGLNILAKLYSYRKRYGEAEELSRRALDIRTEALGSEHPHVLRSLNNLADLYANRGRYEEANSLLARSLDLGGKVLGPDHPEVARSIRRTALNHCSLENFDASLSEFQKLQESRRNFIAHVFPYASECNKLRYLDTYPLIDYPLLSFALMDTTEESRRLALEMVLSGKAAVVDALSAEREVSYCSYDEEVQENIARLSEIRGEISTLVLSGAEKLGSDVYSTRLSDLRSAKDSLETELNRSCAEFRDELSAHGFGVSDVAHRLPGGGVLWEFIQFEPYDFDGTGSDEERSGPPRYAAFTLDGSGRITLTDLGDAAEIDGLVGRAREMLDSAADDVYSERVAGAEARLREVTQRLYGKVFSPLEKSLSAGNGRIFVSPDGQLNLLPFEILPCPGGHYAVERYRISYLSSGRDLLKFEDGGSRPEYALVMADPDFDASGGEPAEKTLQLHSGSSGAAGCLSEPFTPLPYTREEAESIVEVLRERGGMETDFFSGGEALEERLKNPARVPGVLHLATHGYFCERVDFTEQGLCENPLLRAGMALAGANTGRAVADDGGLQHEDGILTAYEISGLDFTGTDLATLSACETGVGEVKIGEGVFGLRRVFQYAGAQSILMSLWKVPDRETGELMDGFYRHWLGGRTRQEALRASVRELMGGLRERYGVAHPFLWGGFILTGNPR